MFLDAFDRQGKIQIRVDRGGQTAQMLFFGLGRLLAIVGAMPRRWRLAFGAKLTVFDAIGRQRILDQKLSGLIDFQAVGIFQDFHILAFDARHPIIITPESRITVLVGAPGMIPIRSRQMG